MSELKNLETARTLLRKLTIEDAKDFYTLNLDDEVLKYTGDKPFATIEAALDFFGYLRPIRKVWRWQACRD